MPMRSFKTFGLGILFCIKKTNRDQWGTCATAWVGWYLVGWPFLLMHKKNEIFFGYLWI